MTPLKTWIASNGIKATRPWEVIFKRLTRFPPSFR